MYIQQYEIGSQKSANCFQNHEPERRHIQSMDSAARRPLIA